MDTDDKLKALEDSVKEIAKNLNTRICELESRVKELYKIAFLVDR
jgi:hypothetical protein